MIATLELGGAEKQVTALARELANLGHRVRVICLVRGGPLAKDLQEADVPVEVISETRLRFSPTILAKSFLGVLSISRLLRTWLREPQDVVYAWLPHSWVLALPTAWVAGVPTRVQGIRSLRSGAPRGALMAGAMRLSESFANVQIANSRAIFESGGWRAGSAQRYVIPNGVSSRVESAHPERAPVKLVAVGNLFPYKGHATLLKALSLCTADVTLDIVGDGPLMCELVELSKQLGLTSSVSFLGSRDDVEALLLKAQVLVHPSYSEGSPNAIAEAMASGLPVVATRVGGIPELVEHGRTGLLVAPASTQDLARAIDTVAADPVWRTEAGNRGKRAAQELSWSRMALHHESVFLHALGCVDDYPTAKSLE